MNTITFLGVSLVILFIYDKIRNRKDEIEELKQDIKDIKKHLDN